MIEGTRTESAEETEQLGATVGTRLRGGDLLLLNGPLGAGKSTFAAGVGRSLGVRRWRGSPTFALINEYSTAPPLVHVDLYRLEAPDVEELGLWEYLESGALLLVEWPERAREILLTLGAERVWEVELDIVGEGARQVRVSELVSVSGR